MRVGIYAHSVYVRPERVNNVSGHTQVALRSAQVLQELGCDVLILTTPDTDDKSELPLCYPRGVPIETVGVPLARKTDGSKSAIDLKGSGARVAQMAWSLRKASRRHRLDVLHGFGSANSGALVALATMGRRHSVSALTLFGAVERPVERALLRSVNLIISSSQQTLDSVGAPARKLALLKHGVTKIMAVAQNHDERLKVVFWREATAYAGADLCVEVFQRLAPRYPDISFCFMLRPSPTPEVEGLESISSTNANVDVFRFPYESGVTLEKTLSEAICVVLPFRSPTFSPQFAVLESILAGAPTISTQVGSIPELWPQPDKLLLSTPTASLVESAIESCLDDRATAISRAEKHRAWAADTWSWSSYGDRLLTSYKSVMECQRPSWPSPRQRSAGE